LGIGHPGHRDQVVDYVLRAPSKPDFQAIETAIYDASRVLPELLSGEMERAMHQLHSQ
jgi:PTH1 family peptidyl-tRNA hydrolase